MITHCSAHQVRQLLINHRIAMVQGAIEPINSSRLSDNEIISFESNLQLEPYTAFLRKGNNVLCTMGSFSFSQSKLHPIFKIGRYCSIAANLKVLGLRHPLEWITTSSIGYDAKFQIFRSYLTDYNLESINVERRPSSPQTINIGHDVWIGADVTIKPGITIGHGSVIAANSHVVKDVTPYSIVGGNPARLIRYRFSEQLIEKLLKLQWWQYAYSDFMDLDIKDPENFILRFDEKISQGIIQPFKPNPLTAKDLQQAIDHSKSVG